MSFLVVSSVALYLGVVLLMIKYHNRRERLQRGEKADPFKDFREYLKSRK